MQGGVGLWLPGAGQPSVSYSTMAQSKHCARRDVVRCVSPSQWPSSNASCGRITKCLVRGLAGQARKSVWFVVQRCAMQCCLGRRYPSASPDPSELRPRTDSGWPGEPGSELRVQPRRIGGGVMDEPNFIFTCRESRDGIMTSVMAGTHVVFAWQGKTTPQTKLTMLKRTVHSFQLVH